MNSVFGSNPFFGRAFGMPGSATLPSYSFFGAPRNGFFYEPSSDALIFVTGSASTKKIGIVSNQLFGMDVAATSYDSLILQPGTNPVLFGTSTDSGNGKIQLASHTTSAGGIGFGSDVSLYRLGVGTLRTDQTLSAGQLACSGMIYSVSPTAGIGYATGAGGTVTQITSKSTSVTLNKICGQITMNAAALAAGAAVEFTHSNSAVAANTDLVIASHCAGGTLGSYTIVPRTSAGAVVYRVTNISVGSLSEAIVITFIVIKGVTS